MYILTNAKNIGKARDGEVMPGDIFVSVDFKKSYCVAPDGSHRRLGQEDHLRAVRQVTEELPQRAVLNQTMRQARAAIRKAQMVAEQGPAPGPPAPVPVPSPPAPAPPSVDPDQTADDIPALDLTGAVAAVSGLGMAMQDAGRALQTFNDEMAKVPPMKWYERAFYWLQSVFGWPWLPDDTED